MRCNRCAFLLFFIVVVVVVVVYMPMDAGGWLIICAGLCIWGMKAEGVGGEDGGVERGRSGKNVHGIDI
jgi:hypothetical protein